MRRTKLRFQSIQQIVGDEELAIILLTDEERTRALSVVCDEQMARQMLLRRLSPKVCRTLLPEALLAMLPPVGHEMTIFGIHDGQYQVVLADSDYEHTVRLRMSDAVLLTLIADNIPLYIENTLFERQSVPFDPDATGIAIPINTMDRQRLGEALQHAIEVENYELASHLRDEIRRRGEG
ncbi:MAG: bifunctional nuclease family protein [Prevotella sp.]|nr:bifunctional nuclease family protein [Prevotella sp.]